MITKFKLYQTHCLSITHFIANPDAEPHPTRPKNPPPANLPLRGHAKAARTNSGGGPPSAYCKCTNQMASAALVQLCDSIAVKPAATLSSSSSTAAAPSSVCAECGKTIRPVVRDGFQLVSVKSDDVELSDHVQFLITEVPSSAKAAESITASEVDVATASRDGEQAADETGDVMVTDGECCKKKV